MVPDVVEELEIAPDGKTLDTEFLRLVISETDDHALEQAVLLKERVGGSVTALAIDAAEIDDTLYNALARGADRAVKTGDPEENLSAREAAALFAAAIRELGPADLILTGAQAIGDLDGLVAPLVAHSLGLPYLGTVTAVVPEAGRNTATVTREFPGGVRGEFEVPLPAVLGIQAAEKPPRYVPVAKVRAAMKSQGIETCGVLTAADAGPALVEVLSMAKPEPSGHARMLEGDAEELAAQICELMTARGLL
jgi:electron transfer flavoprotein beta subunit